MRILDYQATTSRITSACFFFACLIIMLVLFAIGGDLLQSAMQVAGLLAP